MFCFFRGRAFSGKIRVRFARAFHAWDSFPCLKVIKVRLFTYMFHVYYPFFHPYIIRGCVPNVFADTLLPFALTANLPVFALGMIVDNANVVETIF